MLGVFVCVEHTFASLLVNHRRLLYEVQKILGHSQIRTTERYAHLDSLSLCFLNGAVLLLDETLK